MLRDFLNAQRFDVDLAGSGDEGIGKVKNISPDIVLLSRELPMDNGIAGPDGLRVLKVIKQDRKLAHIPIILTSAEASEKDFDRYRKLKFTAEDYVRKPFEDTEIIRRIENLAGFDLSDSMDDIESRMDDAMDESLAGIFDVDPEELGSAFSTAARREVAQLIEQVREELDRQDTEIESEEKTPPPEVAPESAGSESPAGKSDEVQRLRAEVTALTRKLDKLQRQLVGERKKSRDIKKEWKQKLQAIAAKLQEKEEREIRIREEFEEMRERFADLELDHTMELERVHAEKRRIEEEMAMLRETAELQSRQTSREAAAELKKLIKLLQKIVKKLEDEKESG